MLGKPRASQRFLYVHVVLLEKGPLVAFFFPTMLCLVCQSEPAEFALIPCGHLAYCKTCDQEVDLTTCPCCREQVKSRLRIFFPGELPPNIEAIAPPPAVHVEELKTPCRAVGVLALSDVSHADLERFEHVETIEKWMLTFESDFDSMPIDDALDFLDVTLTEESSLRNIQKLRPFRRPLAGRLETTFILGHLICGSTVAPRLPKAAPANNKAGAAAQGGKSLVVWGRVFFPFPIFLEPNGEGPRKETNNNLTRLSDTQGVGGF